MINKKKCLSDYENVSFAYFYFKARLCYAFLSFEGSVFCQQRCACRG